MKSSLIVNGMLGVGDILHQRAIVQHLMRDHDVTLRTTLVAPHADLLEQGLKIHLLKGGRMRDAMTDGFVSAPIPKRAASRTITYGRDTILANGSILGAMYRSAGLAMPPTPDFSVPIRAEWIEAAERVVAGRNENRPILVYRPITLNRFWNAPARSPDPIAYSELYRSIRQKFFVVSLAFLGNHGEYVVGPDADVDMRLERGEIDITTMLGLHAIASMAFVNPGFGPVTVTKSMSSSTLARRVGSRSA